MPVKIKDGKLETAMVQASADPMPSGIATGDHVVVQPTAQIVHQHTKDKGKTLISESHTEEKVGSAITIQQPYAEIEYTGGRVYGDGNFGSFRVGVTLKMPCGPQFHLIEEAYEFTRNYVNTKLVEELKGTPVEIKEDGQ